MHVLSFRDPNVRHILRQQSALHGTERLGRGCFSAVYAIPGTERVLKLVADRSHLDYLYDRYSPQGPYKPKVYESFGEVGQTSLGVPVYLIEMERLHRLRVGTLNGAIAGRIVRAVRCVPFGTGVRQALPDLDTPLRGVPGPVMRYLSQLQSFQENFDCHLDLHWANFMERADGTLVFSDPVFDYRAHQKVYPGLRRAA